MNQTFGNNQLNNQPMNHQLSLIQQGNFDFIETLLSPIYGHWPIENCNRLKNCNRSKLDFVVTNLERV